MKTIQTGRKWGRNRRRGGSVVVIVALSSVALLGCCALAVDYGVLNSDANRVQRACDAAALAGAAKLKKSGTTATSDATDTANARSEAILVAQQNGVTITAADVTFSNDNTRIRVRGSYQRQFLFAPILRVNSGTVIRQATAEVTPIKGLLGAVPLVITTRDYEAYKNGTRFWVQLERMQGGDGLDSAASNASKGQSMGEVVAVDTDPSNMGKSPSWWEDGVKYGTDDKVKLGIDYSSDTAINANEGNQSRRLADAMEDATDARMRRAADLGFPQNAVDTYYPNYPAAASPRIFTIMVADETPSVSGNNMIEIKRFATVFLSDVNESGQGSATTTQMQMRIMPASYTDNPNAEAGYPEGTSSSNFPSADLVVRLLDDM
ncbi:MAG TPA: pilus assembly protein TadG-related protein [Abditibacteriaceae bacterium]|jgi:Flp pilus assembly protein TadG